MCFPLNYQAVAIGEGKKQDFANHVSPLVLQWKKKVIAKCNDLKLLLDFLSRNKDSLMKATPVWVRLRLISIGK